MTAQRWLAALATAGVLTGPAAAQARWVAKDSPTSNALVQVQCLDESNIWVAGVGGVVLHSSDGGEHWDAVDSGAPLNQGAWNSLSFVDEATGWFAGLRVTARTSDAGGSWQGALIGGGSLAAPPFQNALFAVTSQVAWTAGADLYDVGGGNVLGVPTLWRQSVDADGKFQDYTEWVQPIGGIFYDLEFIGKDDAWAVGYSDQPDPGGIIYRIQKASTDPIITMQPSGVDVSLEGISLVDEQQGWIVGDSGLIMRTKNGGASWTSQVSTVSDALWDVDFVDADRGWAVGEGGVIVSTKNGGAAWQATTWRGGEQLTSVDFLNVDLGFAVGASGTILKWEPDCADAARTGGDCADAGAAGASASGGDGGLGTAPGEPEGGQGNSGGDPQATGGATSTGGASVAGDGASSDGTIDAKATAARSSAGCGCRTSSAPAGSGAFALGLLMGVTALRRRRRASVAELDHDLSGRGELRWVDLQVTFAAERAPAGQVEFLRVQRADHGGAAQEAVGQHAAAVGTVGLRGVHLALPAAEDCQLELTQLEGATLTLGDGA